MPKFHKARLALGLTAAVAVGALTLPGLLDVCDVCEAATAILLSGTVDGKCTINVSSTSQSVELPIGTPQAHRVMIGSALQDCNGKRSYIVSITSMNCARAPAGGKILDPVSGDFISYSAEFINPATGGSDPSVPGLLASSCVGQVGREVVQGKVTNETSQIYLNFTGSADLSAGTYQDVVTISLNMQ